MSVQAESIRHLVERNLQSRLEDALADTRVVLIGGPRQAGKSTLSAHTLGGRSGSQVFSLDNRAVREAAAADPLGFVELHASTMLIDEVQRVPELGLAIKEVVDREGRPGQFLLTGSASIFTLPQFADALVGRMEILTLYPFSQGELRGKHEDFIDRMFGAGPDLGHTSSLGKQDYVELAVRGGYPEVVQRQAGRRRSSWFASYLGTTIQRDLRALAQLDRLADVPKLLRLAAARTASPLNMESLARDAGIAGNTVRHWLALLENIFILAMLPAWSNNRTSRAALAPKLFMVDSGLAAYLVGVNAASFKQPTMDPGWLLETLVVMDLVRQLGWSETECSAHHFRTRDGDEVDCVLEAMDRRVVGVEVKSAATVTAADFRGLRLLARAARSNFKAGIVLYTGARSLSFGDGMFALPISALWA